QYFAAEDGRIYRNSRPLVSQSNGNGYLRVSPSINGTVKTKYVHRLVCEAYHGPCPVGMECRHLNGRRYDNRPLNLAWSDKKTNEGDKRIHGTLPLGEKNQRALLTSEIVL